MSGNEVVYAPQPRPETGTSSFFDSFTSAVGRVADAIINTVDRGLVSVSHYADRLNAAIQPLTSQIEQAARSAELIGFANYALNPTKKAQAFIEGAQLVGTSAGIIARGSEDINAIIQDPNAEYSRILAEGQKMYEEDIRRIAEAEAKKRAETEKGKKKAKAKSKGRATYIPGQGTEYKRVK